MNKVRREASRKCGGSGSDVLLGDEQVSNQWDQQEGAKEELGTPERMKHKQTLSRQQGGVTIN